MYFDRGENYEWSLANLYIGFDIFCGFDPGFGEDRSLCELIQFGHVDPDICYLYSLSIFVGLRQEWTNPFVFDRKSRMILVFSAINIGFLWRLYFGALQLGDGPTVVLVDKSSRLFTALLFIIWLGGILRGGNV